MRACDGKKEERRGERSERKKRRGKASEFRQPCQSGQSTPSRSEKQRTTRTMVVVMMRKKKEKAPRGGARTDDKMRDAKNADSELSRGPFPDIPGSARRSPALSAHSHSRTHPLELFRLLRARVAVLPA